MNYDNGEITVAPKVIYWVDIPNIIKEHEKIELLKRDILVIPAEGNFNMLDKLRDTVDRHTAYFFNLDELYTSNKVKFGDILPFASNLLQFIQSFAPDKCLIHSSMINNEVSKLFLSHGISYIEKNLTDKKIAFSTILGMIKPFFTEKQRLQRSMIRLNMLPLKQKVEIINLEDPSTPVVTGYLKDLSLNGLGFVLMNKSQMSSFDLKQRVQVKLYLQKAITKINLSLITRLNVHDGELGITYNITDTNMIREDYASHLTSLIYNWIKQIIAKYGKIEVNDE